MRKCLSIELKPDNCSGKMMDLIGFRIFKTLFKILISIAPSIIGLLTLQTEHITSFITIFQEHGQCILFVQLLCKLTNESGNLTVGNDTVNTIFSHNLSAQSDAIFLGCFFITSICKNFLK